MASSAGGKRDRKVKTGITTRPATPADVEAVVELINAAAVQDIGQPATGVLLARPEWEGDPRLAWIDEPGVLRPWRQKGIGLALLHRAFAEFHRRGRYKVGVDGGSLTGATRLYERAGMHVFEQIDAYEKVVRPGTDLSTQSLE